MVVELIEGFAPSGEVLRRRMSGWREEIAGDVPGWRGTTAGVADDGTFVALFEFDHDASSITQHQRWCTQTLASLGGDATRTVYPRVPLRVVGEVEAAGFVQVVVGRVHDVAAGEAYLAAFDRAVAPLRPDMTGRLMANRDDGRYVGAFYFASESAARAGEAQELPADLLDLTRRGESIGNGPPRYIDLRDPWLFAPAPGLT